MTPQPQQHPKELNVRWSDLMDLLSEGNMCSRQDIIDRIKGYNDVCQCRLAHSSRPAPSPDKGCHWYKDGGCTKEEWLNEWERRAGPKQITLTSELPTIIPPLPKGDTKDLKTWKEYWKQHDATIAAQAREKVLDEIENFAYAHKNDNHYVNYILLRRKINNLRSTPGGERR